MRGVQENGVHNDIPFTCNLFACVQVLLRICVAVNGVSWCVPTVFNSVAWCEYLFGFIVWCLLGGSFLVRRFRCNSYLMHTLERWQAFRGAAFLCRGAHFSVLLMGGWLWRVVVLSVISSGKYNYTTAALAQRQACALFAQCASR